MSDAALILTIAALKKSMDKFRSSSSETHNFMTLVLLLSASEGLWKGYKITWKMHIWINKPCFDRNVGKSLYLKKEKLDYFLKMYWKNRELYYIYLVAPKNWRTEQLIC